MTKAVLSTPCGEIFGIENSDYDEFRGIRYASAKRWEYPIMTESWEGTYDATDFGDCCFQHRAFEEDAKVNPFYHKEFRRNMSFTYSEDCLFLNVFKPKNAEDCPVLVYIHGGSFTGGSSNEGHISGAQFARNGIVFVSINYRLGPFGFCAHPSLEKDGACGNFGLYDQLAALKWINKNIASFGGDNENVTLLGQSAGAMSVDILISSPLCCGLFSKAVMMSGAGLQRAIARPLSVQKIQPFWEEIMKKTGASSMEDLRKVDAKTLFYSWRSVCDEDKLKSMMFYTLPVFDGKLVTTETFNMKSISKMPKLLSVTSEDMLPIILAELVKKWVKRDKKSDCFVYRFSRRLPGDDKGAWHSSDLPFVFSTLQNGWRPYEKLDYCLSEKMSSSVSAFVKKGDPNCDGLPLWRPGLKGIMNFGEKIETGKLKMLPFLKATFKNKPF